MFCRSLPRELDACLLQQVSRALSLCALRHVATQNAEVEESLVTRTALYVHHATAKVKHTGNSEYIRRRVMMT